MSGGGTGTSKDQLNRNNKLVDQQLQQQQAIRDQLNGSFGKYLSGAGQGFDPQQLAIMQSQFLDQNAAAGRDAAQQVNAALAARGGAGGALPVGGDYARALEGLYGQVATSQSQGILGTNLANLQQALTNRFNAGSLMSGQAAQLGNNIGTFSGGANNSLNQYVAASQSGFLNQLGKGFGSALGQGLGSIATGGIGTALGGIGKFLSAPPAGGSSFGPASSGFPGA